MSGVFHWAAVSGCLAKCHALVKKRMVHCCNSHNPMNKSAGKANLIVVRQK